MKKFMAFALAFLVVAGMIGFIGYQYLLPKQCPVFLESFGHGVMTVDSSQASGSDEKYTVHCKRGQTLTVNINPERTEDSYYNLSKLVVNGKDVTDEVNMLQYKVEVREKLDILAYFKKGKRPSASAQKTDISYDSEPDIIKAATNPYIGSEAAYNFSSPSVIFDEKSGYYYCFGSSNVVARSKDLVNWDNRTTYFASPSGAKSTAVMKFSDFPSVEQWAKTHGYDEDESFSSASNNREPQTPEIIKIGSVYYLYFSLSKTKNANESAIFCVRTTDLAYSIENHDWQDAGIVISSCGYNKGANKKDKTKFYYDESYAVSPSVFFDKDGGLFMAYGSYYGKEEITGGIYLLELNAKTGLLKDGSKYNEAGKMVSSLHGEKRYNCGTLIAKPGSIPSLDKKQGSLITDCEVIYNAENGYYYLFMTYGTQQNNFQIRVARSKTADGPYTDIAGEKMNEFSSSGSKNQYTKGVMFMGGYNFYMSSGGGVSYTDVGKASTGCPSILKTADGKWIMAIQSQLYYKAGDSITTGDEPAKEYEVSAYTKPCLDIRQIFFEENGWPLAVCEAYTGEKANRTVKASQMNGQWDVLVLDTGAAKESYDRVERSVAQPVTIFGDIALSKNDIENKTKISKLAFAKKDSKSYTVVIDGVAYTVYPTVAWDWELSQPTYVFSGFGEDGSTVWGKKNFSAYMGIYTDAYYYLLSLCDSETKEEYEEKMNEVKQNPSQDTIDEMTNELLKKLSA